MTVLFKIGVVEQIVKALLGIGDVRELFVALIPLILMTFFEYLKNII